MKAAALGLLAVFLLATPAAAQDHRVWSFDETEEGVHLRYGTPETDDVPAAFVCRKGSNSAELYLTFEHWNATDKTSPEGAWLDAQGRPEPWRVDLTLAGVAVKGEAVSDEMNGGSTVSYVGASDAATYRSMSVSGRLRAEAFGETLAPPPFRKADFRRFLQGCKG